MDSFGKGAGKGALIKKEHTACLSTVQDMTLIVFADHTTKAGKVIGCAE